jgi:hypothetical protein
MNLMEERIIEDPGLLTTESFGFVERTFTYKVILNHLLLLVFETRQGSVPGYSYCVTSNPGLYAFLLLVDVSHWNRLEQYS